MSRAYRVSVKESVHRVIKADDHVSTHLEILQILPADQMGELLARELEEKGFVRDGKLLVREKDGILVTVNPTNGEVVVQIEDCQEVKVEQEVIGSGYDDVGESSEQLERKLREEAKKKAEETIAGKTTILQGKVTDQLEGELEGLRGELDQVINRVTAEALKQKAAQMGQIKEISEDKNNGNLTIVIEV